MQYGGINNEPFWKSRRVWGAALTAICGIAVVFMPDQYEGIVTVGSLLAASFGIQSFRKPMKK